MNQFCVEFLTKLNFQILINIFFILDKIKFLNFNYHIFHNFGIRNSNPWIFKEDLVLCCMQFSQTVLYIYLEMPNKTCLSAVKLLFYVYFMFFFFFCSNYGSGYDTLGQQGNKDFTNSYSSNGQSKSTGGSAGAGSGKGEVPLSTYQHSHLKILLINMNSLQTFMKKLKWILYRFESYFIC